MELKCHFVDVTDVDVFNLFYIQKRCLIRKQIFCNVTNDMKMFNYSTKNYAP
jgi:hypothetical protein